MSLNDHKRALGDCTYCPKLCRFCCPTAQVEHRETVTPWAKMSLSEMVRTGRLEVDNEIGEVFYHCFACLHCRTHCRHENDVPGALIEARREVLAAGSEPEAVSAVIGRFSDTGNAWGEDLSGRLKDLIAADYFVPEAQAALFTGCDTIRQDPNPLADLFELCQELGVDYLAAHGGEQVCCGIPLWQAGDVDGFIEHATVMARELARYRKIVCTCPTCAYAFRVLYPQYDVQFGPEVVHLTEFLEPLLAEHEPRAKVSGKYTYHDPCYLARFLEDTEGPRRILGMVLEEPLAEIVWSGNDTQCCGGGGLVPHVLPEVASAAADLRVQQLAASGAGSIITACPGCFRQLSGAQQDMSVVDLVEIVARAYLDRG